MMKKPYWIIQSIIDKALYWSNEWGWGSKQGCYKIKRKIWSDTTPWDGKWIRVKSSKN
jgi:hypothetical protein